jgi:signal transduction histidine kinase
MVDIKFTPEIYKQQFEALFRELPIPTFMWQTVKDDMILLNYNNAAEQITEGYAKNFMGIKASVMYKDQQEILDDLNRCAKEKTTFSREMSYTYQLNGKEKYLHVTYGFISPNFVIVHTEDITGQIQVEQKLMQRNIDMNILNQIVKLGNTAEDLDKFLEDILDSTISLMNFDGGGYYFLNPTTNIANLMNHKGLPSSFIDKVKVAKIKDEPYRSVFIDNHPIFIENYSEFSPKWKKEWGILSVASIPLISKGKTIGALNIASKKEHGFSSEEKELLITIGREVGTTLGRLQTDEDLREAFNRVSFYKDLFMHDISNIINNIHMALKLSSLYIDDPKQLNKLRETHEIIRTSVIRSIKLISNVSKLSQIEDSDIPLSRMNLIDKISEAKTMIGTHYLEKDVIIQVESENQMAFIRANELLLDVFENIIINAIKYNENPVAQILINVSYLKEASKNFIKLEFIDNGIGIEDFRKESIFNEGSKDYKMTKGMGFGLTLVKKIVLSYHGKIWVEDKVKGDYSKGCNFIILLPMDIHD